MTTISIYKILNKTNNKVYIGSSVNFKRRKYRHISSLRKNQHDNPHLQSAWNKYGEHNFEFSIVETIKDDSGLRHREFEIISMFNSNNRNFGYNFQNKANGHYILSDETRANLSLCNKGRKRTNETKRLIGIATKSRIVSDETREKHSQRQIGEKNYNFGKPRTPHTRLKIKMANTKRSVYQCSLNGDTIKQFTNANEAAKELNIAFQNIYAVCNGKRKMAGGFTWRFCEKEK